MAGAAGQNSDVFPHDRVVFFSDAVFAIAITLLAIELKAPTEDAIARVGAAHALGELVPLFTAFVISFFVAAQFWASHLLTWKCVARVTGRLLWLGIGQLFFVVLMPFATALYSESFRTQQHLPLMFYCLVLTGVSLFGYLARREVLRESSAMSADEKRWFEVRARVPLLVFAASIPLALVVPTWAGGLVFILIFPATALARRWTLRRPLPEPAL